MQTKPKSNSIVTSRYDEERNALVFEVRGEEPLVLELDKVHQECVNRAVLHGFNQRIIDASAKSRSTENGAAASPAEKREAMARLVEHYNSGAEGWSPSRVEGAGGADAGLVILAMLRATVVNKAGGTVRLALDVDAANSRIAAFAEREGLERQAAMAKIALMPEVAERIQEIRTERAVAKAKASGLSAAESLADFDE